MNNDLIFALSVITLVIIAVFVGISRYQATLNKNLLNRGGVRKHFSLPFYVSSVIAVASLGSYGFYFTEHLGKYYFLHPFSANMASDITELDYLDLFHQLQDKSGSETELKVSDESKIWIKVGKFNTIKEISLKAYGKKRNTDVRFNCFNDEEKELACRTQYYDESDTMELDYFNAKPYFEALSNCDLNPVLMPIINIKSEIQISFHELDNGVTDTLFNIYNLKNSESLFQHSLIVDNSYILIHVQDKETSQGENQTEWSYIIQL